MNESEPIDLPCVLEDAHSETPALPIYRAADFGRIKRTLRIIDKVIQLGDAVLPINIAASGRTRRRSPMRRIPAGRRPSATA